MSRLTLATTFKRPNSQALGNPGTLVKLPRDPQSLRVTVELPDTSKSASLLEDKALAKLSAVELAKPRSLRLVIHSGRNEISKATIKLSISSTTAYSGKATLENGECLTSSMEGRTLIHIDTGNLEPMDDCIVVRDIKRDSECVISVPHSDVTALNTMASLVSSAYPRFPYAI